MVPEELVISQYAAAKQKFPKLNQPEKVGETWKIKGGIDVIDDEGSYWDTYEVTIIVPKIFPEELFELHETGNKIIRNEKWHNSKSCCLSTNATIFSTLGDDITLLNWLVKFAHPFLANHVFKLKTGDYAGEEFEHYTVGIIQGYEKLFGLKGVDKIVRKLKSLCSVLRTGRNEVCFCGSGKKYKNCYLDSPATHKFSGIPFSALEKDFFEIINYLTTKKR